MALERIAFDFAESGASRIQGKIAAITAEIHRLEVAAQKAQANMEFAAIHGKAGMFSGDVASINKQLESQKRLLRAAEAQSQMAQSSREMAASARMAEAAISKKNAALMKFGRNAQNAAFAVRTLAQSMLSFGAQVSGITALSISGATGFAKMGGALLGAEQLFRKTAEAAGETSDVLVNKLRAASSGTVTSLGLMNAANFAFLGGAKLTSEELQVLVQAATKLSAAGVQVHGATLTAEEGMQRFTQGIIKQERRIVDDMTVVIRAKDVMKQYGAAARAAAGGDEALTKVIAFKMAIVDAARDRLKTLGDVNVEQIAVGQRLTVMFSELGQKLAAIFVSGGFAEQLFKNLSGIIEELMESMSQPGRMDEFFRTIVSGITVFANVAKNMIPIVESMVENLKALIVGFLTLQGVLAGVQIGRLFGPWGALIGGAIGGGGGLAAGLSLTSRMDVSSTASAVSKGVNEGIAPDRAQLEELTRQIRNQVIEGSPSYGASTN